MTARELSDTFADFEYETVLRQAGDGGWLAPLIHAHATPCTVQRATTLIRGLPKLPRDMALDFRPSTKRHCGRAFFNRDTKKYRILLPSVAGTGWGRLRVGLVLHEAAHIWDWRLHESFSHGPHFCHELREALRHHWEEAMPTSSYREIYDRHRGPFSLLLTREVAGKKGQVAQQGDHLKGPMSAEEAHEEACLLVNDPRENIVQIHVYSDSENQFCGAFYKRGGEYKSWEEETDGRLEFPDECTPPTLLRGREEPVQEVDAAVDSDVPTEALLPAGPVRDLPAEKPATPRAVKPSKLPGDRFPVVRGRSLELDGGNAERWPKSQGAQVVRAFYEGGKRATAAEVVATLGSQLRALGVEFPGSLVSRLKQGGFLKEVMA